VAREEDVPREKRSARVRREMASRSHLANIPNGGEGMPNRKEKRGRRGCRITFFQYFSIFTDPNGFS
jgi:hypothetical protein